METEGSESGAGGGQGEVAQPQGDGAGGAAQPQSPAAPPEWQQHIAELRRENAQFREQFSRSESAREAALKAQQEELEKHRQWMRGIYDPEGAKRDAQPKYLTQEQVQQMLQKQRDEERQYLQQQQQEQGYQTAKREFAAVKAANPDFFKRADWIEDLVLTRWSKSHDKSLTDVVNELKAQFDKDDQARQQAWQSGKKTMQQTIRPTTGAPPAPTAEPDDGPRGKGRLLALRRGTG